MTTTPTKQNNDSADILKFIMSVFVVATHTSLFEGYITPVVRLAVPVFFVLSGYFFFSKVNTLTDFSEKKGYLIKSVEHNLKLYLFWFVALLPLTLYVRKYFSGGVFSGVREMLKDFLFASTFQSSWYITALIIGIIIVFFLSQKLPNFALIIVGIVFYLPSLLSSNYLFLTDKSEALFGIYQGIVSVISLPCRNFAVGIIYLVLGKILAENKREKARQDGVLSAVFFLILVAEHIILDKSNAQIINSDCYIMLPFAAFYLCRAVLASDVMCSFSMTLRKMSTISYCLHMAVFMVVGKVFSLLNLPDFMNIGVFLVTLILTWTLGYIMLRTEKIKAFTFLKHSH